MKYLIALLTAATAILHLVVGFGIGGGGTNWLLVLNGVGYLVLLVLFWMASGNGGIIRWVLLAYTLITLIGYFAIAGFTSLGFGDTFTSIATIIKAIELLLVILLLLYRGKQTATTYTPAATSSRMGSSVDPARSAGTALDMSASSAAAGTSTAAAAAAAAAISATDPVGETYVDTDVYVGDRGVGVYDAETDFVDDTAEAIGDAGEAVVDTAGDAVDYVGDKAEDAYDATADMAGDAAEAIGDAGEAIVDTAGDAVDYVGDKAEDAYDAAADMAGDAADALGDATDVTDDVSVDVTRGAAIAGSGIIGAVGYDSAEERSEMAAELNAEQLAAEPSADEVRAELEEYLKSFGPSSEFRKPIEYVEGIGAAYGQKLRTMGIVTVMDLVANGATRRGRKHIADQTGIAQSLILTWVNHVDLFRIKGVAEEYADLLEQSGVDTVVELAQRNPANLFKRMKDVNDQKGLVRRIPHASEVESWVQQAKSLRRLIYY